jgi:hypothetical protein
VPVSSRRTRKRRVDDGKLVAATTAASTRGGTILSESTFKQQEQDGRADFDFFVGSWTFRNRCLREWLQGSTSWEAFEGRSVVRKILGGLGHIEEVTLERASGNTKELVVRLFDPETHQWSVHEADNRNGFDPRPVIGEFKDGRIEGYSHMPWEGKYIFRRVIWSDIAAASFHWEQAFSSDGGTTWETNWIADFVRDK